MNKLRVLCGKGDVLVEWDPAAVAAGEKEAGAAVKEAERIFQAARARGGSVFAVKEGEPAVRVDEFDPWLSEQIVILRMVGG